MLVLLRVLSYPMVLFGVGILPIFWNPLRKSFLQKISFVCCTSVLLFCLWLDRKLIFTSFFDFLLVRIGRVLLMYFTFWWNNNTFFTLTYKLLNLSNRYQTPSLPRKQRPLLLSVVVLALSTMVFLVTMNHYTFSKSFKRRYQMDVTLAFVFYNVLSKFIGFLVPALYIIYISEFTYLFHQADYLWKEELKLVLAGNLQTNLQPIRIFHSEISSVIYIFRNAFGINLLHYFAYVFADILITFYRFSDNYDDYLEFTTRVVSGTISIWLMIKFTQDMAEASEGIVSNLKSLELENLPNMDQLQVELMVKKVQCQPVTIDVYGMFVINRQLLAEIVMGATTYCNAIVQLQPYIRLQYPEPNINNATASN